MADTKISALTGIGAIDAADEFAVNDAGTSKKATAAQIVTFVKSVTEVYNTSTAAQGPGFSSDTYLTGSSIAIPSGALKQKTIYKCVFDITKTAAGTATPIINIRFGTNGSTADTSRGTLTFTGGTAAVDDSRVEITAVFRAVGASAVLQTMGTIIHRQDVTGFVGVGCETEIATSGTFDSAAANSIIGLSVNGGTSAAWTVNLVQAELVNLA